MSRIYKTVLIEGQHPHKDGPVYVQPGHSVSVVVNPGGSDDQVVDEKNKVAEEAVVDSAAAAPAAESVIYIELIMIIMKFDK